MDRAHILRLSDSESDASFPGGEPPVAPSEAAALDAYSQVVMRAAETVGPAVGNIEVGHLGRQQRAQQQAQGRGMNGSGSGVVFAPDGFILTKNHLEHGVEEMRRTMAYGRQ